MKIVAKALITDSAGNTLFLVRSKTHPRFPFEADLPGGEVEANEPPQSAVSREVKEETGLVVPSVEFQLAAEQISPSGSLHQLYIASIDSAKPTVKPSWEHVSYEWASQADLPIKLQTKDAYMDIVRQYLLAR